MLDQLVAEKKFPRPGPGSPTLSTKMINVSESSPEKSSPELGFPTVSTNLFNVSESSPEEGSPSPGKVPPPLYRKSSCSKTQPRKKFPRLDQGSPTPCHVTSHHATSRHVTSHHVTSHHVTSRHVTTTTTNCNGSVGGFCTGIISF